MTAINSTTQITISANATATATVGLTFMSSTNGVASATLNINSLDVRGATVPLGVHTLNLGNTVTGLAANGARAAIAGTGNGVAGVTFPTIASQGAGYTSAPTVNFTGGGGTGATAVANISGIVTGFRIYRGAGYGRRLVTFTGGGGTGACGVGVIPAARYRRRHDQRRLGLQAPGITVNFIGGARAAWRRSTTATRRRSQCRQRHDYQPRPRMFQPPRHFWRGDTLRRRAPFFTGGLAQWRAHLPGGGFRQRQRPQRRPLSAARAWVSRCGRYAR